jgi:ATP-dependent Clp protease ATP-binding subunit ClpA
MPKINVYLPDDLAAAVRAADVPVSAVCQRALADAVQIVQKVRKGVTALRNPQFDPDSHPQFAARLVSRMTPRLRQALTLAREASAATHLVMTQHLLLGIVDQHDNLAVRLLQSLGQDVDMIRDTAQQLDSNEPLPATLSAATEVATPSKDTSMSAEASLWTGLTLPSRIAIGAALEASIDFGHNYLGCEHLLLGLLDDPSSGAGQVLHNAGIDKAAIRRAITSAASGFAQARQDKTGAGTAPLDELIQRLEAIERRLTDAHL